MCQSRVRVAGLQAAANMRELFHGSATPSERSGADAGGDGDGDGDEGDDDDDDDAGLMGHPRFSSEDTSYLYGQLLSVAFIGRLRAGDNLAMLAAAAQDRAVALFREQVCLRGVLSVFVHVLLLLLLLLLCVY